MKITVGLQDKMSYVFWPLIVFAIVAAMTVLLCILIGVLKERAKQPKTVDGEQAWRALSEAEKNKLRMKYFSMLDELYARVNSNQISVRHCYQRLSRYVREFVSEITGVKVNKCTLSDIRCMNMPMLANLVEEYYAVEFAKVSMGDAGAAIVKTKRVIEIWN